MDPTPLPTGPSTPAPSPGEPSQPRSGLYNVVRPIAPEPKTDAASSAGAQPIDWRRLHLWQIQPLRDICVILLIIGLILLGQKLSLVTVPILLALTLSYLFEPLIRFATTRLRFSRSFSAALIILLSFLIVVVPVFVGAAVGISQGVRYASKLSTNIDTLVKSIDAPDNPSYRAALPSETWRKIRDELVDHEKSRIRGALKDASDAARDALNSAIPGLKSEPKKTDPSKSDPAKSDPAKPDQAVPNPTDSGTSQPNSGTTTTAAPDQTTIPAATTPTDTSPIYEGVRWSVNWLRTNAGTLSKQALSSGIDAVGSVTAAVTGFGVLLFQAFLTAFFFFSFSTGWPKVIAFGRSLLPHDNKRSIVSLIEKMDRAIAAFIRGRLTICAILTVHYSVGYFLIGVPAPFLLGPIVAILALFPYISGIGVPVAILLLYLEPHTGIRAEWWWVVFAPVVVFMTAQALDDYVLTPTIQGKHTDMNVAMILFASISGGLLGGFYGLLLAIPAAACIRILIIEVVLPRIKAWSEGRAQDLLPIGASTTDKK